MEELVAELGAAFLCADLSLTPEVREDHAAYIASWLKVLRNDKRAVFTAAAHAQRAADYLHQLQPSEVAHGVTSAITNSPSGFRDHPPAAFQFRGFLSRPPEPASCQGRFPSGASAFRLHVRLRLRLWAAYAKPRKGRVGRLVT